MSVESNWDLFHKARWERFIEKLSDIKGFDEKKLSEITIAVISQLNFLGVDYKKRNVVANGLVAESSFFTNAIKEDKYIWQPWLLKCFPECMDLFIASGAKSKE